jgi:hypothetical protein
MGIPLKPGVTREQIRARARRKAAQRERLAAIAAEDTKLENARMTKMSHYGLDWVVDQGEIALGNDPWHLSREDLEQMLVALYLDGADVSACHPDEYRVRIERKDGGDV